MEKQVWFVEIETEEPVSMADLQHALGEKITVISIEKLESCAICDGLSYHRTDCPLVQDGEPNLRSPEQG